MTGFTVALYVQKALCNLADMRLQNTKLEGCKAMEAVFHSGSKLIIRLTAR